MAVFQRELTATRPWGAPARGDMGMLGNPQRLEAACFRFPGQFVNRDRIVSSEHANANVHGVSPLLSCS